MISAFIGWPGQASAGCDDQTVLRGELITAMILLDVDAKRGIRVVSSPGGTGAAAMALALVHPLIIDGVCNSSCAWAFVTNEAACFTPRALFGFHASHDPGTGKRMTIATAYWLDRVRPALATRLSRLQSSSTVIKISAAQMAIIYGDRACPIHVPRSACPNKSPSASALAPALEFRRRAPTLDRQQLSWPVLLGGGQLTRHRY